MNPKLKEKTLESLSAVLPITGIMLLISIFIIPMEIGSMVMFLVGALLLILGMGLFQLGAELSMTPIGEGIGSNEEKEFVLIIADVEKKIDIMNAISKNCGVQSEAQGLVFSLPIDSVMGI